MWEVLDTSEIMDAHIRFVPGEKVPVKQIGTEIKRLNEPNTVDVSSERIMQVLKASAEEYVGSTDQLFRNATNAGGGKTLGEIREGIKQNSGILNIDVINWNNFWTRVYRKIFYVLQERLEDTLWVNGVPITREDFNFPADIKANGSLEVSDTILAKQTALARLQLIAQFLQVGVVDREDVYNALQDYLEKDGVKDPDRFSTSPIEITQTQLAQLEQLRNQLTQQVQILQDQVSESAKQVAKNKKMGKKAVDQVEGQLEATVQGG
jgi:hypothetical protein